MNPIVFGAGIYTYDNFPPLLITYGFPDRYYNDEDIKRIIDKNEYKIRALYNERKDMLEKLNCYIPMTSFKFYSKNSFRNITINSINGFRPFNLVLCANKKNKRKVKRHIISPPGGPNEIKYLNLDDDFECKKAAKVIVAGMKSIIEKAKTSLK